MKTHHAAEGGNDRCVNAVAVATGGKDWVLAGYPVKTSISDEELVVMPTKK